MTAVGIPCIRRGMPKSTKLWNNPFDVVVDTGRNTPQFKFERIDARTPVHAAQIAKRMTRRQIPGSRNGDLRTASIKRAV